MLIPSLLIFFSVNLILFPTYWILKKAISEFQRKYEEATSATIDELFLSISPTHLLILHFILGSVGFILGLIIGGKYIVPVIVFTVGFGILPTVWLKILKKRRDEKFEAQFADAMRALANSLKSGLSIMQSLEFIIKQYGPPFSIEFAPVIREVMLGTPFDKALENLAKRIKSEDVDIFSTSVSIAKSVGGSLSDILDQLATFISERRKFKGKLKALTAEARGQAFMLAALPWIVSLLLYLIDKDTYSYLFKHWLGWLSIGIVIILETIGVLFIRKIMKIEY